MTYNSITAGQKDFVLLIKQKEKETLHKIVRAARPNLAVKKAKEAFPDANILVLDSRDPSDQIKVWRNDSRLST
jgi:hypothetical protein